jgi:hypothetical protein
LLCDLGKGSVEDAGAIRAACRALTLLGPIGEPLLGFPMDA